MLIGRNGARGKHKATQAPFVTLRVPPSSRRKAFYYSPLNNAGNGRLPPGGIGRYEAKRSMQVTEGEREKVKELLAVFLRRLLPSFSSKMPPPSRREAYMGNPFTGN